MKLCKFALGVVALAVSTSSLAGMVTTSSNLEFLAINGQKASKSLLKEKKSFNADANQTQQVVVRLGESLVLVLAKRFLNLIQLL